MNDADVRELQRTAGDLQALTRHPSWQTWKEETERRIERDKKRLLNEYLTAGKPVDQRVVDHMVGFWDGIRYAVAVPDKAQDTLDRALRAHEQKEEADA